jgi:hypothetical protein
MSAGTKASDEWIGVADVAAELGITPRQAWHLIGRLGVPCLWTVRNTVKGARILRRDWEACRDRSKAPPEPRAARGAAAVPPPPAAGDGGENPFRRFMGKGRG